MQEKTGLTARVDKNLKTEADIVFGKLGLTMSEAINIFLYQVVHAQGIPFPLGTDKGARFKEKDIGLPTVCFDTDFFEDFCDIQNDYQVNPSHIPKRRGYRYGFRSNASGKLIELNLSESIEMSFSCLRPGSSAHATCRLPFPFWFHNYGFSDEELDEFRRMARRDMLEIYNFFDRQAIRQFLDD